MGMKSGAGDGDGCTAGELGSATGGGDGIAGGGGGDGGGGDGTATAPIMSEARPEVVTAATEGGAWAQPMHYAQSSQGEVIGQ